MKNNKKKTLKKLAILVIGSIIAAYGITLALYAGFGGATLAVLSPSQLRRNLGWIRYITFTFSLVFVASLFLVKVGNIERIMFWAFIVGNLAYYAVGIALAFAFKDNRAFYKYICPIAFLPSRTIGTAFLFFTNSQHDILSNEIVLMRNGYHCY